MIFYDTFSILLFELWPVSWVQVWHFPCRASCQSSVKSRFLSISHFWSSDLDGCLLLPCLPGVPSECTGYCLLDSLVYYRGIRGSTQQRFSYWSNTVSILGQGGECLHSVHSEPENRAGRGPTIHAGPLEYMASGLPQQSKNAHLHLYTPVLIAHWVKQGIGPCPASRSLEAWGTGGMCSQVEEMLCLFREYIWNLFLPLPHLFQDLWPAQFAEPPDLLKSSWQQLPVV